MAHGEAIIASLEQLTLKTINYSLQSVSQMFFAKVPSLKGGICTGMQNGQPQA